jgi:CRISPR-associated protein Csm5
MKKHYEITIRPLTGIHIGTGESLTAMDYFVKPVNKKTRYITYSQDSIVKRIIDDPVLLRTYERACNDVSLSQLLNFFESNFSLREDLGYICDITDSFAREYARKKTGNPLDGSCEVLSMYRPAGKKSPVIPGSSFKGSLRTAMLNQIMHDWDDPTFKDNLYYDFKKAQEQLRYRDAARIEGVLQKKVFGNDPKNDLFRTFLFGDATFTAKDTQIVGKIENIVRTYSGLIESKGIPVYAEVLKGSLMGSNEEGICHAIIDTDLQNVKFKESRYKSMQALVQACNYFFLREFNNEAKNFYDGSSDKRLMLYKQLQEVVKSVENSKDTFVVRMGRWSQAEFVTCEKIYRMPKVPKDNGYGNTRMVFDYNGQLLPLGWCLCQVKEV